MAAGGKRPSKTKKVPKKSAAEKAQARRQNAHKRDGRAVFLGTGFRRINSAIDVNFTYRGTRSDFDDAFLLENVLVLCEYTTKGEGGISEHIKKKKVLYDKINSSHSDFIAFLRETFPQSEIGTSALYKDNHYKIVILYGSINDVKDTLKAEVPGVTYYDYFKIQYFKSLSSSIRLSARSELLAFLGVPYQEFGPRVVKPAGPGPSPYRGSVLPDAQSGFPKGYKIVSFYADAEALLERCYVLRKDGWRDGEMLYQRMLSRPKLEKMRRYLADEGRVYVNNIIATLPNDTAIRDQSGTDVTTSEIARAESVEVHIPPRYNCIGIVDGQHRVLSYHEGGSNDKSIAPLRHLQNLLVTGIVYPPGISEPEKVRFEAGLFLEINSTQANANPGLKQAIAVLLTPFDPASIAREVVNRLNAISGSVGGEFERYFYDKDKIKIASIVSFGVRPLVKLSGTDSTFAIWTDPEKNKLLESKDDEVLRRYVNYAAGLIDIVLGAIKARVGSELWTRDRRVAGRLLTTTTINGAVALLRQLIEGGHKIEFDYIHEKLNGISAAELSTYKSSQYNRLGRDLYSRYF